MITPKEQLQFDQLRKSPNIQMLFDRLDLQIIPSPSYKSSLAISARVDELIVEFKKRSLLPQAERSSCIRPPGQGLGEIFCQKAYIEEYLITLYGPRPWKTPLPHAPF